MPNISWMTTPAELDEADSVDLEKLLQGNEIRTICCLEVVQTDCIDASCGHGEHEFRIPEDSAGNPGEFIWRDDFPCVAYIRENHVLAHPDCPNRRDRSKAVNQADLLWKEERNRTRDNPLGSNP